MSIVKIPASSANAPSPKLHTSISQSRGMCLSDQALMLADMPPGSTAILVIDDGHLKEERICQLYHDIERIGTMAALLAANAWQISSRRFKGVLLSSLGREENARMAALFDRMVCAWASSQGSSYASQEQHPGAASLLSNVERESFDVAVHAYSSFADDPISFGWSAGPKHLKAVKALAVPIREAFESEIDAVAGVWPGLHPATEDWLQEQPESSAMPEQLFDTLIQECCAALLVRQARNQNGAQPLEGSDKEVRARALGLYRQAVSDGAPIITDFAHLAKAALKHVEEYVQQRESVDASTRVVLKMEEVDL